MSSLKKMIDDRMNVWGIDILLISASKFVKCKCFDYSANEGNTNCKICFGRGYVSGVKKARAIIDFDSPTARMNKYSNSRIGKRISDNYIVYFKSDVSVQEGDIVLIVGWKDGKIMDVKHCYQLGSNYEFRHNQSELASNVYIAIKRNENIEIYNKYINSLPLQAKTKIENGGIYICPK